MTKKNPTSVESARYQTQHAKVLRFEVSVGSDDADRTIEQFEQDIRAALVKARPHNVTAQGSYYIIDGKVCLPDDYDPATLNRVPGTYPPQWAGGPAKGQAPLRVDDDDDSDSPREFIRVSPTRSNERHPVTGRRVRRDKGVKRGPRSAAADSVNDDAVAAQSGGRN